jgi:dienelactone hydrolase
MTTSTPPNSARSPSGEPSTSARSLTGEPSTSARSPSGELSTSARSPTGEPSTSARSPSGELRRARDGDLSGYQREVFVHGGESLPVYRRGSGPAVLIMTELPGIHPQVVGFADMVVELGCTAVLPDLFGAAGSPYGALGKVRRRLYALRSVAEVCMRREFTLLATGKHSPIVDVLRALAVAEHRRCGGPGVGAIGMCFTGGFALALAVEPCVLAPVLSQPSLPATFTPARRANIDLDPEGLRAVAARCAREDLQVLGLRFKSDRLVSGERFAFLRRQLGDAFVAIELPKTSGHPDGPLGFPHSVLTGDLIDHPGEPTYEAREQVLALLRAKLLG